MSNIFKIATLIVLILTFITIINTSLSDFEALILILLVTILLGVYEIGEKIKNKQL